MTLFSKRLTQVRLFLASPSDLKEERAIVSQVIARLNSQIGKRAGFVIDLVQWPTGMLPGIGSEVQDVVNRQIQECDIYVFLIWKRLGTPTKTHLSGTVEEFERAHKQWTLDDRTEVLVYLSRRPFYPSLDELDEFRRVLAFHDQLANRGVSFFPFETTVALEDKLFDDLSEILLRRKKHPGPGQKKKNKLLLYELKTHRQFHGTLTDLLNRGQSVGLIHLDFDNFADVRDANPRRSEKILAILAQTIFNCVAHRGQLFRYAGDEFAILIPERPESQVLELAEQIRATVESAGVFDDLHITTSVGVGCTSRVNGYELWPRVYDALYAAKLTGRNRVVACPLTPAEIDILAAAHFRAHS